MINNQIHCVIVKVIVGYDYIYNIIDNDYISSGYGDYVIFWEFTPAPIAANMNRTTSA